MIRSRPARGHGRHHRHRGRQRSGFMFGGRRRRIATRATLTRSPAASPRPRSGNVFVADTDNQRIRPRGKATGQITTVAGTGASGFSGDGGAAIGAQLDDSVRGGAGRRRQPVHRRPRQHRIRQVSGRRDHHHRGRQRRPRLRRRRRGGHRGATRPAIGVAVDAAGNLTSPTCQRPRPQGDRGHRGHHHRRRQRAGRLQRRRRPGRRRPPVGSDGGGGGRGRQPVHRRPHQCAHPPGEHGRDHHHRGRRRRPGLRR